MPNIIVEGYDLLLKPELENEIYQKVAANEFDIVAIQAHSDMMLLEVVRIVNHIKEINSKVRVIAGGNAATYLSQVLFRNSDIDIIIKGEGEITFHEVVKAIEGECDLASIEGIIFRDKKRVYENRDRDLITEFQFKRYHSISITSYSVHIKSECTYSVRNNS